MSEFVIGAAVGAGLMIAKEQFIDKKNESSATNDLKRQLDSLSDENEKLRNRNKDLECQVDNLLSELNKVRKKAKESDDDQDDLQDELDKAKRELKNTRMQNDELARKVKEYKTACEAQEAEIAMLKSKID